MKAGIIGAMEPEVAILKAKLANCETSTHAGYTFYQGQLNDNDVVIVQSGIGKVAAALATAILIDKFQPDYVVNTGSAGGFDVQLKVGDIVVSSEVRYHDVDLTAFGYEIGQLPANPAAYIPHQRLISAAKQGINKLENIHAITGLITTGDTFMTKEDDIAKARKNFPTMAAVEMEGAAVAQVCYDYNVPFAIMRTISDKAKGNADIDFKKFAENIASTYALGILKEFLD